MALAAVEHEGLLKKVIPFLSEEQSQLLLLYRSLSPKVGVERGGLARYFPGWIDSVQRLADSGQSSFSFHSRERK